MTLDLLSLDAAFEGLPYCPSGPANDTSLDLAFEGLPFAPYGAAVRRKAPARRDGHVCIASRVGHARRAYRGAGLGQQPRWPARSNPAC